MKTGSPYRHGGVPGFDQARFGLSHAPLLDFSVNLNFLGPPEIIRQAWPDLIQAIEGYPSVEGGGIGRYYQEKLGIPPGNFLAGNGSTEMIYLVPKVLGFKSVVVVTPSYHDYERASGLAGAHAIRYPLLPENSFSLTGSNALVDALDKADALWLGRPNNPTGNLFPRGLLLELAARLPDKWFVVDEAFIQFTADWEKESLLLEKPRPNILVIHSLTKFYALAGLRLGGIVGDARAIARLRRAKEPWSVNAIAERIAPLLLRCGDYERRTRINLLAEKERIFKELEGFSGVTPFPSTANFILCRWNRTGDLDDLIFHFLSNGAYLRDCRNFPGLEENFFRVGLKTPEKNDRLLSLFRSFGCLNRASRTGE
jgi:threonine-phosphate decarboxylase